MIFKSRQDVDDLWKQGRPALLTFSQCLNIPHNPLSQNLRYKQTNLHIRLTKSRLRPTQVFKNFMKSESSDLVRFQPRLTAAASSKSMSDDADAAAAVASAGVRGLPVPTAAAGLLAAGECADGVCVCVFRAGRTNLGANSAYKVI
jgi:hypothetical protein